MQARSVERTLEMIHEMKKASRIIEELTMYFLALGATHVESSIDKEGKKGTIHFRANYDSQYQYRLDNLENLLNQPKNKGMADLYWELAGSGDPGESNQLLLVGMMIDKAEVKLEDSQVSLVLHKELE